MLKKEIRFVMYVYAVLAFVCSLACGCMLFNALHYGNTPVPAMLMAWAALINCAKMTIMYNWDYYTSEEN